MDRSLTVVAGSDIEASLPLLRRRLDALRAFYAPAGATSASLRAWPAAGVAVAVVEFGGGGGGAAGEGAGGVGGERLPEEPASWAGGGAGGVGGEGVGVVGGEGVGVVEVWGEPLPRALGEPGALVGAGDEALRAIEGTTMAVAVEGGRCRVVGPSAGPAVLHERRGERFAAWSSHAVAAAWLADGRVEIDRDALVSYLAFDFVGGGRTFVAGTTAVPAATVVDDGQARSYWPAPERWSPVPEPDAYAEIERALLGSLERRVGAAPAQLALTAGADSRVLALALRELGVKPHAFTWGEPGWPDVERAAEVATSLGFEHARAPAPFTDGSDALVRLDRMARWRDGATALSLADRHWPSGTDRWVSGMGGETGRAFYWQRAANLEPRDLLGVLNPDARLGAAHADAKRELRAQVAAWIDDARLGAERARPSGVSTRIEDGRASGGDGWRVLDVLYAEQRVARWGRSQIPPLAGGLVGGFVPATVARALSSMSLADRTSDAFHRRFVAERAPKLAIGAPPPPLTRPSPARRLARRVIPRRQPAPAPDPLLVQLLAERPEVVEHLSDVLMGDWVTATLGRAWGEHTLAGVRAGHAQAVERAFLACAPLALDAAVRSDLRPER